MRAYIAALGVLITAIILTACSTDTDKGELKMSPQELRVVAQDLYQAVTATLGEDGWTASESWSACDALGGAEGVTLHFDAYLRQPLSDEPAVLSERVQAGWKKLGIDAKIAVNNDLDPARYILSDPPFRTGVNKDGSFYDLELGAGIANFSYTSPCVPGDIFELTDQK